MKTLIKLKHLLAAREFVSHDETRIGLNGVNVQVHGGRLIYRATNGRIMARIETDGPHNETAQATLPNWLLDCVPHEDDIPTELEISDSHLFVSLHLKGGLYSESGTTVSAKPIAYFPSIETFDMLASKAPSGLDGSGSWLDCEFVARILRIMKRLDLRTGAVQLTSADGMVVIRSYPNPDIAVTVAIMEVRGPKEGGQA